MRFHRLLTTIDGHAGAAKRVIIGGLPNIPGKTMVEKREFIKQNLNHLVSALNSEPRGHKDQSSCIMTPPVTEEAAFGAIFVTSSGYIDMCGSGAMVVATIAIETGMVEPREPVTEIVIDTPAGPIRPRVSVEKGKAKSVTLENVPSFFCRSELVEVPGLGKIPVDIAYGGNFYAIVEAKDLRITTQVDDILRAVPLLEHIKKSVTQQIEIRHPLIDDADQSIWVLISDQPTNPKANAKNILVTTPIGHIDRSPCGTGTSARLATLYSKAKLGLGETFVTESITGILFESRVVKEIIIGGMRAVIPEVTGTAFITGMHQFVFDEDDPFRYGLRI